MTHIPYDIGDQMKRGFFGRRSGKSLKGRQAELMADFEGHPYTLTSATGVTDLKTLFPAPVDKVWLESGFGGGEHLIHRAKENRDTGFIGVEVFRNGMAKALTDADEAGLENIRLHNEECGPFLDTMAENALDGFYLLYPDPWPKKRHFKRRFVNRENLDRIARVLKPGTEFRFASDIDNYVEWTLEHCAAHPAFEWTDESEEAAHTPWTGWPGTRYEEKALREGRVPRYLTFRVG